MQTFCVTGRDFSISLSSICYSSIVSAAQVFHSLVQFEKNKAGRLVGANMQSVFIDKTLQPGVGPDKGNRYPFISTKGTFFHQAGTGRAVPNQEKCGAAVQSISRGKTRYIHSLIKDHLLKGPFKEVCGKYTRDGEAHRGQKQ